MIKRWPKIVLASMTAIFVAFALVALPATSRLLPSIRVHAQVDTSDAVNDPTCKKPSFLGLKPWYYYLPLNRPSTDPNKPPDQNKCVVNLGLTDATQNVYKPNVNKLWLIGIVVFEDLLRVAGLVAVGFVIYAGVRYITSQGEPDQRHAAMGTLVDALIGVAIAVAGATIVAFVANKLTGP